MLKSVINCEKTETAIVRAGRQSAVNDVSLLDDRTRRYIYAMERFFPRILVGRGCSATLGETLAFLIFPNRPFPTVVANSRNTIDR